MDAKTAVAFLSEITTVPKQQNRGGWIVAHCPMAPVLHENGKDNNPSFGLKLESGDPFVSCFSCGYHGKASGLMFDILYYQMHGKMEAFPLKTAMTTLQKAIDEEPMIVESMSYEEAILGAADETVDFPEWWLDTFVEVGKAKVALKYLQSRGVTPALASALDLRFDSNQKRVCFPVRDFDGNLRGLHGRDITGTSSLRYRMYTFAEQSNPIVWLGENWVDFDKPIIVVEGPFDLISVMRVYRNVVSPLFANPSIAKLERMLPATAWLTFLDHGKAGDLGRKRIDGFLPDTHEVGHVLPLEGHDPGSMSEAQLRELLDPLLDLDPNPYG